MSFVGLLKAASAGSKTAKLIKGAKGVFTILEITDTVMDTALLGDEIARAIMGEDYDPAVRDLSREVSAAGKIYDEKMTQVAEANLDITNLSGGINSLKEIFIDYGDKQELVMKQAKKLDDLKQLLMKTVPTTYSWFETIGAKAVTSDVDKKKLEAIKEQLGPNYLSIALLSGGLGFRAVSFGYDQYKKRKQANEELPERKRRNAQADIFEGIDPEDVRKLRIADITANKSLKSRAKTVGKVMYKGVTKLMTIGSFGMNIYTVVMKVQAHDKAMADLREMLNRYNKENPIYDHALSGSPDEAALNSLAEFFAIDISSEDTKSALKKGYYTILGEYENTVQNVLSGPEYDGIRGGGIDGAYTAMINKFRVTAVENADTSVIISLENSYNNYKKFKQIALDKSKQSEARKSEGLDKIRDEFISSVSNQLNQILATLNVQIDDHNSLNILIQSGNKLSKKEAEIEEKIKDLKTKYPDVPDALLQDLAKSDLDSLKSAIKEEADSALIILNITSSSRSKFKTVEEVEEAIRQIIQDLKTKTESVASIIPIKSLNWVIQGPGTTSVKPDESTDSITCDYSLSGRSVWTRQTWTYYTISSKTGDMEFDWNYSGFHAWFRPFVQVSVFADGSDGRKYVTLLEGSQREGQGKSTIQINKGESFGFVIKGSNYDRDSRLLGTLKINFKA
ncbi:hypothetical protein [Dolichospermum sp. UHCC 0259]|uniref:hypothetical protein n=1 Tax=Dolichospermum sp. UHCC 0259 TaxID=2590010 RepID=UPI001444DB57|nr:hypothetical protein [Dolichospermum sp. UHCC 0259]MTJ50708.1 hypothetical protein [Dolichospermum sp. UHCC 0259]